MAYFSHLLAPSQTGILLPSKDLQALLFSITIMHTYFKSSLGIIQSSFTGAEDLPWISSRKKKRDPFPHLFVYSRLLGALLGSPFHSTCVLACDTAPKTPFTTCPSTSTNPFTFPSLELSEMLCLPHLTPASRT